MIRMLLIEPLAVVRESLALAFAATGDMQPRCCSSMREGSELLQGSSGQFDVVLLNQHAGGEKADELLAITNRNGLKGRVLIITPWLSDLEQRRLGSLGVAGIFDKERPLEELIGAVRDVAGGQTWRDKRISNGGRSNGTLTGQERRAAELVFEGLANKEIGVRMGVSESCIKALLQRVFLKKGVHTRGQLVRVLMEKPIGAQPPSDGAVQILRSAGQPGTGETARDDR